MLSNGLYLCYIGCTGSLRYMAPEVAMYRFYREKVDIYSFGLILYEIITGVTPFFGYSKRVFYKSVVAEGERPPLQFDDYGRKVACHEKLKVIMARCWDNDVSLRPNATELLNELMAIEDEIISDKQSQHWLSKTVGNVFAKKDRI